MVTNIIIACNHCGTTFRLRWQVEDYKAPVLLRCPKCNSKIRGLLQTGENLTLSGSFNNAHIVKDTTEADYVQEISAEFITHKLKEANQFTDFTTPFIRSNIYDHEGVIRYLRFIDLYPNEAENVHDLLKAKSTSYLKEKLRDEKNQYIVSCKQAIKKYCLNSEVDLLMASHQYIMVMLLGSGVDRSAAGVMDDLVELTKQNLDQVKEFSKIMDTHGYYESLNTKFPALVELYNRNYLSLVSTLMLDDEQVDLEEWGLSSVDYEDLLELYRKCYEFIGEFIIYIIGLNNIYERGGYNEFSNGASDIEDKVKPQTKYNRIQSFVKENEKFSVGYCDTLNKIIRNAEAHFDVEYDIFTQKIKFINHGKKNTDIEEMYLLQFAKESIKVFNLAVKLWEIAYQLQKNRMICDLHMEWNYGRP